MNAHPTNMKWHDATSWSRGEKKGEPRTFELDVCDDNGSRLVTLVVTRHIRFPDTWVMSTRGVVHVDTKDLHTDDAEGAKAIALELVYALVDATAYGLRMAREINGS